jgi:crotonobetainyl-CoA:carnitine CoA-transferase CaiB-like acyl-CoA transferase
VKVVACSTAQAGTVPYMLMADLGAEVIKIEVPEVGDNSRGSTVMPGFPSTYFETNNRGVKSLTLNLKTAEGREILRKLVATADIFGQNFRPGAAEKNGFGYEELRQVNPRLVYLSVSGYGPKGPHADLPGTDSMAQALGGIAEAYSTPGQPLKTGIVSVADETCAILAFGGALAAHWWLPGSADLRSPRRASNRKGAAKHVAICWISASPRRSMPTASRS